MTSPTSDNLELATLTLDGGKVVQKVLSNKEVDALLAKVKEATASSGDA